MSSRLTLAVAAVLACAVGRAAPQASSAGLQASQPRTVQASNVPLQPGKAQPAMPVADAVNHLGDLDYATRTSAAASLRRRPAPEVAPALLDALEKHGDGYVRFRVLVLLSAFSNPRIPD